MFLINFSTSSLSHNAHYDVAVILLSSFQMLFQSTTEKMVSDRNGIRLSPYSFWPEAQKVLMAQPVLEMSELIRFTKPCIKWSVQISVAVRQSFNKNKALLHKEESHLTLRMTSMPPSLIWRCPWERWASLLTYQKKDLATWLLLTWMHPFVLSVTVLTVFLVGLLLT